MKDTVAVFWQFLRAPQQSDALHEKPTQVWRPFLQLFVLKLVLAIVLSALVYGLIRLMGHNPFASHRLDRFLQDNNPLLVLLAVALIGPAVEEFFFRAPLRFTRMRLFVAFMAIIFFVLPTLLELTRISTLISVIIWMGALMLAIWVVTSDIRTWRMRRLWEKHFGDVFYTFTIIFALTHLANYDNLHLPVALMPLLVVPQFIGALFWGYIRLRFSLTWAMVAHGMFNTLLLGLAYLMALLL
ncbi:CPBP family glutamic-type intramembrane protease [uncultured Pontibacter sp.]|uniref:CPBP family glutamic-type intramembrane protease n=1 Tax=uncultured Pontibacter sp. TaxID=453356 RepID=UPI0026151B88|nr:CPBP family glutamic-type intramembrane protease [uncultured Pontibacter sp.]